MIKYYVVLDTNVIVSALLKAQSVPGIILEFVYRGMIVPIYNSEIIEEYKDVLTRPKFKIPDEEVDILVGRITELGIESTRKTVNEYFPDFKDVVFYEVTMSAKEKYDAKLVTGNTKHFPEKEYVLTPREFLELIINNS
ncbi:putative toxin-antitoxin system toxin component, PIN family [Pseudobutyrivibrio xylanivorans]|uniref:Putative toxin-antitoxin system toxin component, PIN family n=1 Tax=Pseudobutyrivibrio xylanivorans DSM 14809 TaxID=1123012 RepID=A0A1M6DB26_PSEXY|nr:putative toxin-antitoxin system toxin component, PIN family [Pseudobutyrivibrio xylanivorans]SHI70359.1 putative toxin-antitoxin system toxin component, PIN family [Pseudobutyrivibrio xylanivorans DSM 14809]